MSKMSIAWSEECLKNTNSSVQQAELEMQRAIARHARIVVQRDHLAMQIEFAKKAGKDGFDPEKFMKKKG